MQVSGRSGSRMAAHTASTIGVTPTYAPAGQVGGPAAAPQYSGVLPTGMASVSGSRGGGGSAANAGGGGTVGMGVGSGQGMGMGMGGGLEGQEAVEERQALPALGPLVLVTIPRFLCQRETSRALSIHLIQCWPGLRGT